MSQNQPKGFRLSPEKGYFTCQGVSLIAYEDIYPAGHQGGVSIIMHGERIAANGDLRFEPTPGQWQPVPVQSRRSVDPEKGRIETSLHYPDEENHLRGFNPMVFPDCVLDYTVSVRAEERSLLVTVDLTGPVPQDWADRLCFNLELFPGLLFGKSWIMDQAQGIFPRQPAGPVIRKTSLYESGIFPHPDTSDENTDSLLEKSRSYAPLRADEEIAQPYASGKCFTLCPEAPALRMTVESLSGELCLYDGRMNHNNGWFVLSSSCNPGAEHAVQWRITPHVIDGWISEPHIQISQVGYLPSQPKTAVIELDPADPADPPVSLRRITPEGDVTVLEASGKPWGTFLRYRYLTFDFSDVTEEGLYQIAFGDVLSSVFRIAREVFSRGIWQPVLEYFLPVQMCHMRVSEKYRVWHGLCHQDDARMAPPSWQHFDGYRQGSELLTGFSAGSFVPGLNRGGWHDAGDFDLRVESQSGEAYLLSLAYEAFHVEWDTTTIDQRTRTVEIHQPDGKNDILQQIEHGALAVLGGWEALGRLYRGIIASGLRQYVMLGDAAAMTDGIPGNEDDRWVFTEDNPVREFTVSAHLSAVSRALRHFNPALSAQALHVAEALFSETRVTEEPPLRCARFHAAAELYLTTGEARFADVLLSESDLIAAHPKQLCWIAARVSALLGNPAFTDSLRHVLENAKAEEDRQAAETPYGVPYRPYIWGAGWGIQQLGCAHYYLCRSFPDLFSPELVCRALDFILGCHPGKSVSFASGIGSVSATCAYGFNRADHSYIPGGVVSGTALIRPDFPELKEWPFLWQQTEYVLGGGSSRFLFLVLAVQDLLSSASD